MALGSLVVQLAVDLARFRSDMGQAAQISNTRLREIERSAATTVRQLETFGQKVRNAFAVAGIAISVGAVAQGFRQMVSGAIQFGDEIEKAAAKTGLQAGKFALLADAARLADIDISDLSKGLRTLQTKISEAGTGAKGPIELFKALGLELEKISRADADQQ